MRGRPPLQPITGNFHRIRSIVNKTSNSEAAAPKKRYGKRLSIRSLLEPHWGALTVGFFAIAGESAANLLQPWPLKVVLDDVLRSRETHGWAMRLMHRFVGT